MSLLRSIALGNVNPRPFQRIVVPPGGLGARSKNLISSEALIKAFQIFRRDVKLESEEVVFIPGCGHEISPLEQFAFSNTRRIIFLDPRQECISDINEYKNELRDGRVEAICNSLPDYQADEKVNIYIDLNTTIPEDVITRDLAHGAYVLCNNQCGKADILRENNKFELIGVVPFVSNRSYIGLDNTELDNYFTEVQTEEQLRRVPSTFSQAVANYTLIQRLVNNYYGSEENLLVNYRRLLELSKSNESSIDPMIRILLSPLPRINGAPDDLFVFKFKS